MLLNHSKKLVIFTPFKCWSTSVCTYFTSNGWENIHTQHPYISGDFRNHQKEYNWIGNHGNIVPNIYSSYKKILLIRNPYERVLSMWKWVNKYHNTSCEFEQYFYEGAKWPTCFPVTTNYPYDELVRVENLFKDFENLDIKIDESQFPCLNSTSDMENHELTSLQKEIIYWWWKKDFDAGNYKK